MGALFQVCRTYFYQTDDSEDVFCFTASKKLEKAKAFLPSNAIVLYTQPAKDKFEILWQKESV